MQSHLVRRLAVAGTAAFAAAVLAACGGADHGGTDHSGSPTASAAFNDADVTFATGMIPHHRQAVEMAGLAATRAGNQQVKELAAKIMAAQGPEIDTMSGWLRRWDRPVPSGTGDMPGMDHGAPGMDHSAPGMDHGAPGMDHSMPGMDHGGGGMPGMMSGQEMADLKASSGAAFDRLFLQMMIRHHQGAITMAGTEQQQGRDPAAKRLAAKIASDQAAEITQMQDLLGKV